MLRKSQSPLTFSNIKREVPPLPVQVRGEGEGRGSCACVLHVLCDAGKGDAEPAHTKVACCQRSDLKHFGLGDVLLWVVSFVRKKTYVQGMKKDMRKESNCSTWRTNKQKIGKEILKKKLQGPKFFPAMPMQAPVIGGYAGILKSHLSQNAELGARSLSVSAGRAAEKPRELLWLTRGDILPLYLYIPLKRFMNHFRLSVWKSLMVVTFEFPLSN